MIARMVWRMRGRNMLRTMAAVAVLLQLVALSACGTPTEPTQAELGEVWERSNVAPLDYKADILAYMRTYLNDPRNIRNAAVSAPARKIVPGDPAERFISCLRYNARKSDGTYAGPKTGLVIYGSGKLDRFIDETKVTEARIIKPMCDGVVLQPFPELQNLTR